MALGIIGVTLYFLWQMFFAPANIDPVLWQHQSSVLQICLALAGTVTGYYFGRIPAERAAASANQASAANAARANDATDAKNRVLAQVRDLHTEVVPSRSPLVAVPLAPPRRMCVPKSPAVWSKFCKAKKMTFPRFLGPLIPLGPTGAVAAATTCGSPASGAPGSNQLVFALQAQLEGLWCWAAIASSVSGFFNQNSRWTQCSIANACLVRGVDCCMTSAPCNQTWYLDVSLRRTGNLQGSAFPGVDAHHVLQAEIDRGNPVCCHIAWNGGGGHFVVLSGYDWQTDDLIVNNPSDGPKPELVPYDIFKAAYRGTGIWDHTYHTKP